MVDLTPIPDRAWVHRVAKPYIAQAYGRKPRLVLHLLPTYNILPEHFCVGPYYDVELMLAMLRAGAWLDGRDWKPYARYAIGKRMRVRLNSIFREPFLDVRDDILSFQLEGGSFKTREMLRKRAARFYKHPEATPYLTAFSRLLLSVADDDPINTMIQPFHWIRAVLATSDPNPVFGMGLAKSEMFRQKVTLTRMLQAKLDD